MNKLKEYKTDLLIAAGVLILALVFTPSNLMLNAISLSLMTFGFLVTLKTQT